MQFALDQFQISINRVRDLISLYNSLNARSTEILNDSLSDILRSALVLTVSALDYYVHEVVTLGMIEIYQGQRPEPSVTANTTQSAFSRFKISLGTARLLTQNNVRDLELEIRDIFSYKSFQQPDKIAEAIRLICDKKLWDEVGAIMGKTARDVKQQLNAIVDRRNKIAHEADINPTYGIGDRWEIDEILVNDAVDFIEQLVQSIHQILQ